MDYIKFEYSDEEQGKLRKYITLEVLGGSPIGEVIQTFRQFLLAMGYYPDTVKEWIGEEE